MVHNPPKIVNTKYPLLLLLWCLNRKGTILQPAEVRNIVTEYVKKNDLVDENNKK